VKGKSENNGQKNTYFYLKINPFIDSHVCKIEWFYLLVKNVQT